MTDARNRFPLPAGYRGKQRARGGEQNSFYFTLPHFVQWKNFVKGEYVMGLEPANCTIDGRSDALARGQMQFLEPGQSATYRLKFHFDDTKE